MWCKFKKKYRHKILHLKHISIIFGSWISTGNSFSILKGDSNDPIFLVSATFVPDCITLNRAEYRTWRQVFEFTNRQMIMTFWMGHRKQWLATLIGSVPKNLILLFSLPGLFFLGPVPFSIVFLVPFFEIQCYRVSLQLLPNWLRLDQEVTENLRRSAVFAPISTMVAAVNVIFTLFKNEIVPYVIVFFSSQRDHLCALRACDWIAQ